MALRAFGAWPGQGLKRRDVARMCWPCLREPPQPMTEKHLIEQAIQGRWLFWVCARTGDNTPRDLN